MAKITVLPHQTIIDGLKGKLDFYVHRGIVCVRRWPRSPGHRRSPAVEWQWQTFTYASKAWDSLSPYVQAAYIATAEEMAMSGRDLFVKSFITSYFREGQWD